MIYYRYSKGTNNHNPKGEVAMNTREIAKLILNGCLDELQRMATYIDTDVAHLLPLAFKMHVLAYDYVTKGEY